MALNRIDKTNLLEKTYSVLKDKIKDGTFQPGEKLSVVGLSEELGVSRTPIRDALNRLETERLIVTVPKVGTFVASIDSDKIAEYIEARVMMEIWAARCLLEFSDEKKEERLTEMDELLQEAAIKLESISFKSYLKKDYNLRFHKLLVGSADNEYIYDLFMKTMEYHAMAAEYSYITKEMAIEGLSQHTMIVNALYEGDFDKTVELIRFHLQTSKDHLISKMPNATKK